MTANQSIEIPESWSSIELGEVIDYGKTTKVEPAAISPETWVLELEDIEKDSSRLIQRLTFSDRKSKSTKNVFKTGDVLYGKLRPYLNKVLLADSDGVCTTEIVPLQSNAAVHGRYLFHWMRHPAFMAYVNQVSHGVNMPRLGTDAGKKAPFILAPMLEQKRIADKLDAVLARVDACRERLDRVPAILGRFRQAVLEAATSGALTGDWRSSRAESLWRRHALGELIADGPKNGLYKPASSYGEGTRILRIDSFSDGYVASFDSLKRLRVIESEIEQYGLRNGDVVINRVNSIEHLGKCALIEGLDEPCVFESNMMRIRTVADLLPKYLRIALCSPRGRSNLISHAKHAVNQASINQSDVRAVEIHLPSLDEQREIVRRVDALFALADSLIVRHATASTALSRLTPALLAKAFRGELVPQDPSDEPAAVLLKRLKTQRSGEGKATKGGFMPNVLERAAKGL